MGFEILGPLRVVDGDDTYSISAHKMEILLVALLINANQVLTVDQLMDEIWGSDAPVRTFATFHVYISQLRKFLLHAGRADNPIITQQAGYLLRVRGGEIDVHVFKQLMREGRGYAGQRRHDDARTTFESALALYRGEAAGNLNAGPIVNQFRAWLDETRLECVERLIDSELALGCHRETVGRLYSLIITHPYNEKFYRQLMLALYRSERQADALKVYRSARVTLRGELGVEPCRGLRDLQHAILTADDRLELSKSA